MSDRIRAIQRRLGAKADGDIGPITLEAIERALGRLEAYQRAGVEARTAAPEPSGLSGGADAVSPASEAPAAPASRLSDSDAFFASIRTAFGTLDQNQVDGFNRLLGAMGKAGWPLAWAAYGLATPWWETNKRMQPVEEGYYLGDRAKAHQRSLRYYPWYGRGDVQLTWERNYRLADDELGLGGELIGNPDKALEPELSARILVWGMEGGKYTGKSLGRYLPRTGPADRRAFQLARYIINGQDKASQIADVALKMQAALQAGGWE